MSATQEAGELLLCPFCGGKWTVQDSDGPEYSTVGWTATCSNPACEISIGAQDYEDLVERVNRRAEGKKASDAEIYRLKEKVNELIRENQELSRRITGSIGMF